jgi:hypothetical protein
MSRHGGTAPSRARTDRGGSICASRQVPRPRTAAGRRLKSAGTITFYFNGFEVDNVYAHSPKWGKKMHGEDILPLASYDFHKEIFGAKTVFVSLNS